MASEITIITPTRHRPIDIVKRCVASVDAQTSKRWRHWIASDGCKEPEVEALFLTEAKYPGVYRERVRYFNFADQMNHYGAGVRAALLPKVETKYVAFLDDDNILVSRYVERMLAALEAAPDVSFAICEILHMGPLPIMHGPSPKIITGVPPVLYNIDTLQVVCHTSAMRQIGWTLSGYTSDGATYQRLGETFRWVVVGEVLGVHF